MTRFLDGGVPVTPSRTRSSYSVACPLCKTPAYRRCLSQRYSTGSRYTQQPHAQRLAAFREQRT
jgi:hypothetical protein